MPGSSHVTGSGTVTNLTGGTTGTYTTSSDGNTLTYKDNDGSTKVWTWDPEKQAYFRGGNNWNDATAHAFFECTLQDPDGDCRLWEWRDYDRGSSNGQWPSLPTGHGFANRTGP